MADQKLPAGTAPFLYWLKLGEDRSFKAVAQHYNVNPSAVTRRAARERWIERLARDIEPQVEAQVEDRGLRSVVNVLADFKLKQIQVGASLIDKGMAALESMQPNTVKECLDAIKLGSELQGRAFEQPKSHVSVEVTHQLRDRLIPAQPRIENRPRLEVTVAEDIEDLLSDEDRRAVVEDMENDDE